MNTLRRATRFAFETLAALMIVLAFAGPGQARGGAGGVGGGHAGFGGGQPGVGAHHGFDGHHDFGHHHEFDHFHGRFLVAPVYPLYGYGYYAPTYPYDAPAYWYYCPSYGAYYPTVTTCPDAWVPVPGS